MNKLATVLYSGLCFILLWGAGHAQYSVGEKIEAEDLVISGVEYDCLVVGHGDPEKMPIEGYPDGYPSDFIYAISGNQHWLCGAYDPNRMPPRCKTDDATGDDHCCDKYVSVPVNIPETAEYLIYAYVMNYPDSACLEDNRKGCDSKSKWECASWFVAWDDVGQLDKILFGDNWNVAGEYSKDYYWGVFPYEVYCLKFGLDSVTVGKNRMDCNRTTPIGCDFPPTKFNLNKGSHTLYLKVANEFCSIDWLMISKVGDPPPAAEPGRPWETAVESRVIHRPEGFVLEQNYPNPFNAVTTINYFLPRTSMVSLVIYNLVGQEVSVLVKSIQSRGHHSVSFYANELPSGTYIYKLDANCTTCGGRTMNLFSEEKEMVLVK